jgi:hypothetical protein
MRVLVLLLGFVGVLATAAGGVGLILFTLVEDLAKMAGITADSLEFLHTSVTGIPHNDTAAILFLSAIYGLFGTLLGFLRCGKQGGVLLFVPVVFAAVMNPYTLAFTWLQAFAGWLSFFVSPLPINAKAAAPDDDDD